MSSLQQAPAKGQYQGTYLRQLPFVRMAKDQREAFLELNVKPVKTYGEACREGGRIAAIFMAWLAENPTQGYANALGHLAAAFDYKTKAAEKGLWVGFFSSIGRQVAVRAGQIDAMAVQAAEEKRVAALLAASRREEVAA